MSDILQQFYNDYAAWLMDGAPEDNDSGFSRDAGLCYLIRHAWHCKEIKPCFLTITDRLDAKHEFLAQCQSAGLDYSFPFNDSRDEYFHETHKQKAYLNEKRRQWVFDHSKYSNVVVEN